jgi:hypothetical protein
MSTERPLRLADLVDFIEVERFRDEWTDLGLTDEDLMALQTQILRGRPAPVVPGTGGLRKMRFAPPSWGKGKQGALRICYALFPYYQVVLLVLAYGKARRGDIYEADKKRIRRFLGQAEAQIASSRRRKGEQ